MNNQIRNIIIINSIVLLFWISTLIYRKYYNTDIELLRNNIISKCNGWCIGHFIHYIFLGYFAPKYWPYMIVQGIIFEIFEYILSTVLSNYNFYIDYKLIQDPITNTLGLIVGILLIKVFEQKRLK